MFEVTEGDVVMPWRLALCDLGDPGWGDPWFPHSAVLLHSHNGMAMWFLCLWFPCCLVSPYQYLSWYNAITSFSSIVTELDRRSLSSLCCWCLFFVCLFFFVCLVVCCFSAMESWRLLDYVQVPYQFTFVASNQWRLFVCINLLIYRFFATCIWTCWTTWRKPRGVGRKKIEVTEGDGEQDGDETAGSADQVERFLQFSCMSSLVSVAVDLETLVSQVLSDFPPNAGFANGLFVMTTATDHKNNLNSSTLKKNYARTLRVETIANSAGGTAEVAIVAQPSTGFLNGRFYPDGSPTEDTEDCVGRITVGDRNPWLCWSPRSTWWGSSAWLRWLQRLPMASKASEEVSPPGIGLLSMPIRSRKTLNKWADGL